MIVDPGARCGSGLLAQPEHRVQVRLHDPVELLRGDVDDAARLGHLVGRVVDQDVEAAELAHRRVDDLAADVLVPDVAGTADRRATCRLDQPYGLLRVGLLGLEVAEHQVGALSGEGDGDRPADAGVRRR